MGSQGLAVDSVGEVKLRPADTPELLQNLAMMVSAVKLVPVVLGVFVLVLLGPTEAGWGTEDALVNQTGWFVAAALLVLLTGFPLAQFIVARKVDPVALFAVAGLFVVVDLLVLGIVVWGATTLTIAIVFVVVAFQAWVVVWSFRAKRNLVDAANPPEVARARLW